VPGSAAAATPVVAPSTSLATLTAPGGTVAGLAAPIPPPSGAAAPGTPAWLGTVNDRAALSIIVERGIATRNLVHQVTGLSKPTASQVMARLLNAGLVVDVGPVPSRRGPSAAGYAANDARHVGVAIEVTRTSVNATLVDVTGTEYPVHRFLRGDAREHELVLPEGEAGPDGEPLDHGAATAVAEIRAAIDGAAAAAGRDAALVRHLLISIPGSVNPEIDVLWGAEALAPWPVSGLRTLLEHTIGATVTLERDVKLATIAELAEADEPEDICLLWLGNGLGLVNVANGAIVPGRHGRSGEIGYLPAPSGPEGHGAHDMQDLLGGLAVRRILREAGIGLDAENLDGALTELGALIRAAEAGDRDEDTGAAGEAHPGDAVDATGQPGPAGDAAGPGAEPASADPSAPVLPDVDEETVGGVLDVIADRIALMAMPTLFLLDPVRLVLAGPTAVAGGELLARLVNERVRPSTGWTLDVSSTRVRGRAPLLGARLLLLASVRSALLDEVSADL